VTRKASKAVPQLTRGDLLMVSAVGEHSCPMSDMPSILQQAGSSNVPSLE